MTQGLDARLASAACFVRKGGRFCDVGTDHAYLPIYLLQTGKIAQALATDIGEGPLASARAHLAEVGLSDRVRLVLTDGLSGLEGEGLTDIAVCGMGGELICRILQEAPFVRDPAVRLILQPMTHASDLRRYLAENGFRIEGECYSCAAGRYYACMAAAYDGIRRTAEEAELAFGTPPDRGGEQAVLYAALLRTAHAALTKQLHGRTAGGLDTAREQALLAACEKLLEKYG